MKAFADWFVIKISPGGVSGLMAAPLSAGCVCRHSHSTFLGYPWFTWCCKRKAVCVSERGIAFCNQIPMVC